MDAHSDRNAATVASGGGNRDIGYILADDTPDAFTRLSNERARAAA